MRFSKNSAAIIFLLLFFSVVCHAQISRGTVKEGLIINSKILGKDVKYTVYLPYDYNTSYRYYPVVYLLHGYTDNDIAWMQYGEANLIADEAISSREIPPMIFVMPDAGVSWYINNFDNSVRYEDFFITEFIPAVEKEFRIRTEKRYRGIAGLSMGGFGTLLYTLKHPDLFTAGVAFSAAIFTDEEFISAPDEQYKNLNAGLYGPDLKGKDRITPHLMANDPFYIVKNINKKKLNGTRLYLDCGDDDFLYKGNSAFHTLLRDLNIPHEYRVRNGGHQWLYWRTGLLDGLKFISESFH
jgi:enterochelin esterase-like enzyme